ncbi:Eco57I restriction-modification methylase domain-containing protein [Sedimentibacter sp.]|uniref:Eco57I restriction-modification methylase domain-containing protein n=1 Tax=Sedimentibacter sp. TaxID=1960295 RepID=UPI0028A87B89|nr:N-6 DNA methylase [Sedimentibacter sp.]
MKLDKPYNKNDFLNFLNDILLSDFQYDERQVQISDNSLLTTVNQLGTSQDSNITVLEAYCDEVNNNKRIAITQNTFRVLRNHGISNALVAFCYGTNQWRLSLLTSKLELKDGKIFNIESNPRRYSYLLGEGAKTHTPYKFLIEKGRVSNLQSLKERFSVEVVNKQFYDSIAVLFTELVGGERAGKTYPGLLNIYGVTKPSVKLQEFAVRLIGRIMFCWFLKEKKSKSGIPLIPESILSLEAVKQKNEYYHSIIEPLFFELLNTRARRRKLEFQVEPFRLIPYLNGGLFNPHNEDYYKYSSVTHSGSFGVLSIPDSWFISLFELLSQYNFTVDENTSYDVDLSIDPEMLGRIFENLLAEINPETGESAKKSTGSFYTPRDIVDYMVDTSLFYYLKEKTCIGDNKINTILSYNKDYQEGNDLSLKEKIHVVDALSSLTIIDPACGSGAFPIGILQKVVYILQQVDENAELWKNKQLSNIPSVELRKDIESKFNRKNFDYLRKLGIIRESIFGVDIQTIATEIAKLRCFLSLIVEEDIEDNTENRGVRPLPNLEFKFISADSLVRLENPKEASGQMSMFEDIEHIDELKRIRDEYFIADPEERHELRFEFDKVQKIMLKESLGRYAKNPSNRYSLLSSWEPFENKSTTWFDPEWMFGIDNFDIVIANPPYIHLEHIKEQSGYYKYLGFKTYEARGDIYVLFYEKGIELLKTNGILCYITSNKWMRAAYGQALRKYISEKTNPIQLIDFSGQQIFDATVDTNILLLSKSNNCSNTKAVSIKDEKGLKNLSVYIKQNSVTIGFNSSNSWTILSPIEQSIKAKIEAVGTPLRNWNVKINFGIKTGCNEAFIISGSKKDELIRKDPKNAEIIRPILRGRDIKRYGYEFADQYLIALFPSLNYDIENYPVIKNYLLSAEWSNDIPNGHGKKRLEQTGKKNIVDGITFMSRKKTNNKWYETQDQIGYWDDFSKQKIVWKRIGSILRFAFDDKGCFGLDSTCFATGNSIKFITAFLNSRVGNYLLRDSPKTGTGDLLISVQAIEPILIPQNIEPLCMLTVENIIEKAKEKKDFNEDETMLDELLFQYFCFSEEECQYITLVSEELRRN